MTIPFLRSRLIQASKKDMEQLLSFSDYDNPPALSLLEPDTQAQFNKVTQLKQSNCFAIDLTFLKLAHGKETKIILLLGCNRYS